MHTRPKNNLKTLILLSCLLLTSLMAQAQVPVPFSPRLQNGSIKVKGDILFVGNNILNRAAANNPSEANTPYNGTDDNNSFNMEYIDIDDDPTTFSSSSASLALSSTCSKIIYAGLYWASTYPYERSTNQNSEWQGTPRLNDWNQVKFKVPGGAYMDLTADNNADPAGQEDAIIFDGYNATDIAQSFKDSPIICYKNVTGLVQALANPNGSYTLANLRAARGRRVGASSAGWVMVVIFEDPTMPGKFISTFDGYAGVQNNFSADINISGFITLPPPFPVRAKLGVGALEGDIGIINDRLRIKANSVATFTDVSNALNPANNFFNSSISNNGAQVPNRIPYGTNTLGLDLDMVQLSNPLNGIIPNNETGATLRLLTSGDGYGAFLSTFAVEIIEPEIKLVKTVNDISGNDIGGADVNLGQVLDYVINFQNIGNDDATNLTIRDILPINTFFNSVDLSSAPGVTYTYNPATREIIFSVPNNIVEIGDPVYTIRIRVQVVNTCSELTDACSNIIQNLAYSTYQGILNSNIISDDPSFAGIDTCGLGVPGPANFLIDIDECAFVRNEILCGASVVLTAGSGYASYQWFNSSGTQIGTTQSITVNAPGSYYVINTPTPPCIGITEYINVTIFGTNQTNPVLPHADEIVICPNDGEQLPKIFLCGLNDSRFIQTNITDAVSILWEKLDEASCPAVGISDCANKNPTCNWVQVGTGTNFNATLAGQYRVVINYQNGCFNRYYFNVFTNLLDAQHIVQNIVCNTPGQITVTNVPSSYEFQLIDQNSNAILFPYQTSPIFPIAQAGSYLIQIRQQGVVDGCVFTLPNVGVANQNFQVNVIPTNTSCNGFGSIRLQALNANAQYYYNISGTSSASQGPLIDNDYTFQNLNPGTYTVTVTTDDGCSFTGTATIENNNNLQLTASVSQHISCNQGSIQMSSSGGRSPYVYAIYSYNGVLQNPTGGDFQSSVIFDIPIDQQGDYVFIMVDDNNCTTLSNEVTINLVPNVQFTTSTQNVTCYGSDNGFIAFSISNSNGYTISYQLLDTAGTIIATSTSGNFPGLAPGDYKVMLVQSQGSTSCEFEFDFTITGPDPITATSEVIQDYTCATSSGTIGITSGSMSGGTGPYQYSIDGITFGTSSTFSGLTAGTYAIAVKDTNGCIFMTEPITFNTLTPPTNIQFSASIPNCPNLTSDVTLSITGGIAPYSYAITAPASAAIVNGNNAVFAGLSPGTYTFRVTDANGCTFEKNYTVNTVIPITVTGHTVNNVSCLGQANGALHYTVSGFASAYDFTVVNSSNTTTASGANQTNLTIPLTNLAAGTYTITVTDTVTSCTATNTVTINSPMEALALAFTVNPITCVSTGSIVANATGGWGSNQFQLTLPDGTIIGPQTSGTFNNLSQTGSHTVMLTDANNCSVASTLILSMPTHPTATIATASNLCYTTANSASITIQITGGLAPFTYSINGAQNQVSNTFSNLTPGTYTIVVTDTNGCTDTLTQVINPQLTAIAASVKNLDCSANPDASISVAIAGGQEPFTYQLSINGGAYSTITGFTGNIINYSTADPGTYQFQVRDSAGCVVQTNVLTIPPITYPEIISITQIEEILCNGNSNGAISIVYDTNLGTAPLTLSVINTTTGTNYGSQTSGLPAGNYEITLTDGNACFDTRTIILAEPLPISYTIATVDITCNNPGGTSYGEIIVENVSGGTPGYTYYVTNNFGFSESYVAASGEDYAFQIITFGIYQVDVVDTNGCSLVTSNIIIASPPDDLLIDVSTSTADCANGGTAQITVTAEVSSGNFQFALLEFNTIPYSLNYQAADPGTPETTTFTGLTPGVTYTFVVYDVVTQCYYFKSADLPIDSPSGLTATLNVVSNVTCTGNGDGNVSFTFSGYDATATQVNYEIFNSQSNLTTGIAGSTTLLPGDPVTVNNFGALPPGNYYILLTEIGGAFTGCSNASSAFSISQSTNILALTVSITKNDNCNLNAGQITAIGQFGTAPYDYQLVAAGSPPPTAATWTGTTANVFNAEGGSYVVYIKDANNCIQSAPIVLPADPSPAISASVINQCNTAEGSFSIQVNRTANGIAPYSYSLNGSSFESNALASFTYDNLVSGIYTIEIRDANGCGTMVSVTVFAPLDLTPTVTEQPSCANNDGEILITPFGGSGAYQYELQDNAGNIIMPFQASSTFSGLGAGNYTVIITDTASACIAETSISLEVPTLVTFTSTFENVSCNGGSDGSITIMLDTSNNNPPYTYTLDNGITALNQNNPLFTGLEAGTYIITVTSNKNCIETEAIVITEPSPIAINATATDFSCDANNTVQTATITINVANDTSGSPSGTAPYSYSINGTDFFPTNTFDIVDNGSVQNFTLTVKDANNCIQTQAITVNPLPKLTLAAATQTTAITCSNDETITIAATGGSGDFTFELLPPGSQANIAPGTGIFNASFQISEPGNYVFQVTDNVTGCSILTAPYEIIPFDTIQVTASNATPIVCFGDANGTITLNVSGYTGTYSYIVVNASGTAVASGNAYTATNPLTINGLEAGNLSITVTATDVPFCSAVSNTLTIHSPASNLVLSAVETSNVTCDNDQGEIIATASGGWGTYQYEAINNTNSTTVQAYSANNIFTGLSGGNYTINVRDSGGCVVSQTVILVQPDRITATVAASVTSLLCFGETNATISAINVAGGQGNYQYILNRYDTTGTTIVSSSGAQVQSQFNNLGAGIYSITIMDGWNCDVTTVTVTITEPAPVQGFLSLTSGLTCNTQAIITVSGSGGTAPYQYSANGTAFSAVSTFNVGSGTYQYYVRDANGCEAVLTNQVIINPVENLSLNLNLSSANINCSSESTAAITANATGGLGNYTYTLLDSANAILSGPQTTETFYNLSAGNYFIRVNSGDCEATSPIISIANPDQLIVNYSKTDVLCFGQTNGSITISTTGGTGIIQYAISPNLNQFVTTHVFNSLLPGVYDMIVQDQNGCFETLQIEILEPEPLEASLGLIVNELCLNDADGSITVDITGGTNDYLISLDDVTYAPVTGNQYTFDNLVGDTLYMIYIKDSNGCNVNPPLEYYMEPAVQVIPAVQIDVTCLNNLPEITVTLSVNEEIEDEVLYSLDGITYSTTNIFTNLLFGDYLGYAQHTNGCTRTIPFTVDNLVPINTSASVTAHVLCFGQATGAIQVTAAGGTGALQYAISPDFVFGNTDFFTNLPAGTYAVRIRDAIGCETELSDISVIQPATPLSATITGTPETCLGLSDGTITLTIAGGTAPYFTSLNSNSPSDFVQDQLAFQNLSGGTQHTIFVRDINDCEMAPLVFTTLSGVELLPVAEVTDICSDNVPGNTVIISVNPAVVGDVLYSLDGIAYNTLNTYTNLAPGNHTVYVQHLNGCIQQATFTIQNLMPVSASTNITAHVLCFGQATGAIQVTAAGGTGALQYAISPDFVFGNTDFFTNLPAGTYAVRIRDAIGCETELSGISVIQPAAPLSAAITGTPETCLGLSDGTITLTIAGGTAPYFTSLNSNSPSDFVQDQLAFQNLSGGRQYTVYLRDANGCQLTPLVFTVNTGVNLQVRPTMSNTCINNIQGNSLTIAINPTFISNVEYSIDGINYAANNTFSDLGVGNYLAYVRHTNGCIQSAPFTVAAIIPLIATTSISNARCFGDSTGSLNVSGSGGTETLLYGISPDFNMSPNRIFQNLAAGTYIIRIQDATGCFIEVNETVNEPMELQASLVETYQEICTGDNNGAFEIEVVNGVAPYATSLTQNGNYIQSRFLFDGLSGGQTYTVYIRDTNGCTAFIDVTLDNPIVINATPVIAYECAGNTVTINVGASVAGDVTYSLDGQTPQTGNVFANLSNGNHNVEVFHALGCVDTATFNIANSQPLMLTLAETGMNQITATATGGSGGYTYIFNGINNGSGNTYIFYATTTYLVTVIDSRGCEAQATIDVIFVDIDIPNVVTPNDDGQNDTWSPGNTGNYPNITTDIFDRYGRKIATLRQGQSWDGRYNGKELPTGDYWYLIKLGNPEDNREFVGNFTIYR